MLAHDYLALDYIARSILLFWALWGTVVCLSDTIDYLQSFGIIRNRFHFDSKNSDVVREFWANYHIYSLRLVQFSYAFIIGLAYFITILFWCAFIISFIGPYQFYLQVAFWALFAGIALNVLFVLLDEIFIQYALTHAHMLRLILRFVTLIVFIYLVI